MAGKGPGAGDHDPELTRTAPSGSRAEVSPDPNAERWGDLRLLNAIGHGGFGRVYRAWDESLAREVALKVIKPRSAAHRSAVLREGQMLARVSHRNVVTVFRAQQVQDEVGLTMELIRGRHLADLVHHGGPMSAEEASVIGISLCHALAAVHGAGLLHRDVKAHNVMRESGGRIVLMDFGAGRELGHVNDQRSRSSELSGTPLYLAPELFAGQPASPRSDLYSLGVLLFFLVTRQYPVEGTDLADIVEMHGAGKRRLLSDLRPDLPDAFVHVVHRALSPAPEQRSPSAGAMLAELSEAMPDVQRHSSALADPFTIAQPGPMPAADRLGEDAREAAAAATSRGRALATRSLIAMTGVLLTVFLLGLLTSAHYNRALGRDSGFSEDTAWTWFEMGVRSLVPSVIYLVLFLVIARVAAAIGYFIQRLVPPVKRVTDLARTSISGTFGRLTTRDSTFVVQALLILQVFSVLLAVWTYRPLIATLPMTVNDADAQALAVLDPIPANGMLYTYGPTMAVLLSAMALSWYWLLARSSSRATIPRTTIAAGAGLMFLVLLIIELPYRLFYKSEAPEAAYAGQRCFVTGARADERLLYCPDAPRQERTPIVNARDLRNVGSQPGRIFAPPPGPLPVPK